MTPRTMSVRIGSIALSTTFALLSCAQAGRNGETGISPEQNMTVEMDTTMGTDTIVLGAGCFWCVEAVFVELKGVSSVMPGYTGGATKNPDYKSVCTGETGHAEVAEVVYDPSVITLPELLEVFWQTHDPTTLNRQGADVGTQYRSAIYYRNADQKTTAEHYKAELDKSGAFDRPIVTEVSALEKFYPAENYHKDYYANNPGQGYCQMVIRPKVEKFRKAFANKVK